MAVFFQELLGDTLDDAAGEAFDKTAKLLGLPYPGGPALEKLASQGKRGAIELPRPMLDSGDLNLSFSGLKTAVLTLVRKEPINAQRRADVARAFEDAVVEVLVAKSIAAVDATGMRRLVVAGGVGANQTLRSALTDSMRREQVELFFPPLEFCTDNGAMIALAGALRLQTASPANYAFTVRPRWELASLRAPTS